MLSAPGFAVPLVAETGPDDHDLARRAVRKLIDGEGLLADVRIKPGFPAEVIADLADEDNAELIVVGSRGQAAFKAAFLGSVSNQLIGIARHPVLVVPRVVSAR